MTHQPGQPGPLRILHLTDNFPPVVGGLELAVQALAQAQHEIGNQVAVVTSRTAGTPDQETDKGVEIHRLPLALRRVPGAYASQSHVFFPPFADPTFAAALGGVLEGFQPDIVHAHGWILYSALSATKRAGVAVVATAHDYGFTCPRKTMFRNGDPCTGPGLIKCITCSVGQYGLKGAPLAAGLRVARRRHREVDRWTGISTAVAAAGRLDPRGLGRMTVTSSFIPDSILDQRPAERPSFVPRSGPYVFFAGQMSAHKGYDVLLAAHRRLWSSGLQAPLVVAAIAPDLIADASPQAGVQVVVNAPRREILAAWRHAAVGVVPSLWHEPFGMVAVECLAAGTPIVASRVGALGEIVDDGECGLLVAPGQPDALAAAIRRLLTDATLAGKLAQAGPARARRFVLSAVLPRLEDVYQAALAGNALPPESPGASAPAPVHPVTIAVRSAQEQGDAGCL